jgi:glycerol-3-phosphate O-acyltransferase/dihydroxyacetone phosphate acyltransferase
MRAVLTALCRLLLRIFFREIATVHAERVPRDHDAPVLYVLNHPNALLDPLFISCLSPRPVTFLAKAPLF